MQVSLLIGHSSANRLVVHSLSSGTVGKPVDDQAICCGQLAEMLDEEKGFTSVLMYDIVQPE